MIGQYLAKSSVVAKRADFYEDLSEALADNAVPMQRFEKQRAELVKQGMHATAAIYGSWIHRLNNGASLSEAFSSTFPESDLMLLSAIESTGNPAEGMKFLANAVRVEDEIRGDLIGALVKPAFWLLIVICIVVGVSVYMAPALDNLIRRDQWSSLGKVSLIFVDAVQGYWALFLTLGLAFSGFFVWSLPRWTGPLRLHAEKFIPLYTIYRDFSASKLLVSLAALMKGNISLGRALQILQTRANPWMRWHLARMIKGLEQEENALRAMDTGLFSRPIMWRLVDYGERSNPDAAIARIGLQSIETIKKSAKVSAVVMNQVMMIAVGAAFIIMVGGYLTTTFGIKDALS